MEINESIYRSFDNPQNKVIDYKVQQRVIDGYYNISPLLETSGKSFDFVLKYVCDLSLRRMKRECKEEVIQHKKSGIWVHPDLVCNFMRTLNNDIKMYIYRSWSLFHSNGRKVNTSRRYGNNIINI